MIVVVSIIIGAVLCVFINCFFDYKKYELDYKLKDGEYAEKAIKDKNLLDKEKEYTEQGRINLQIEAEKTKQLQIKSDYKAKHGTNLY